MGETCCREKRAEKNHRGYPCHVIALGYCQSHDLFPLAKDFFLLLTIWIEHFLAVWRVGAKNFKSIRFGYTDFRRIIDTATIRSVKTCDGSRSNRAFLAMAAKFFQLTLHFIVMRWSFCDTVIRHVQRILAGMYIYIPMSSLEQFGDQFEKMLLKSLKLILL